MVSAPAHVRRAGAASKADRHWRSAVRGDEHARSERGWEGDGDLAYGSDGGAGDSFGAGFSSAGLDGDGDRGRRVEGCGGVVRATGTGDVWHAGERDRDRGAVRVDRRSPL